MAGDCGEVPAKQISVQEHGHYVHGFHGFFCVAISAPATEPFPALLIPDVPRAQSEVQCHLIPLRDPRL